MNRYPGRIYRGRSDGHDTAADTHVWVTEGDGTIRALEPIARSISSERPEPAEYRWGYLGAGPDQLARAMLADHLGRRPHPSLIHQFKEAFVATWRGGYPWELDAATITGWIMSDAGRQATADSCAACGGFLSGAQGPYACECTAMAERAGQGPT